MSAVLEQVEKLISEMSLAEKAQVAERLNHEVSGQFPGIEATPGVCGGDPRIAGHRIPVWVIWDYHRQGTSDAEMLAAYPTITAQDLANALAYARAHREETERLIELNDIDDEEDAA